MLSETPAFASAMAWSLPSRSEQAFFEVSVVSQNEPPTQRHNCNPVSPSVISIEDNPQSYSIAPKLRPSSDAKQAEGPVTLKSYTSDVSLHRVHRVQKSEVRNTSAERRLTKELLQLCIDHRARRGQLIVDQRAKQLHSLQLQAAPLEHLGRSLQGYSRRQG